MSIFNINNNQKMKGNEYKFEYISLVAIVYSKYSVLDSRKGFSIEKKVVNEIIVIIGKMIIVMFIKAFRYGLSKK